MRPNHIEATVANVDVAQLVGVEHVSHQLQNRTRERRHVDEDDERISRRKKSEQIDFVKLKVGFSNQMLLSTNLCLNIAASLNFFRAASFDTDSHAVSVLWEFDASNTVTVTDSESQCSVNLDTTRRVGREWQRVVRQCGCDKPMVINCEVLSNQITCIKFSKFGFMKKNLTTAARQPQHGVLQYSSCIGTPVVLL